MNYLNLNEETRSYELVGKVKKQVEGKDGLVMYDPKRKSEITSHSLGAACAG